MSLNWNLSKIADCDNVCFEIAQADDTWHGVKKGDKVLTTKTYTLLMLTMAVGLRGITDANKLKFWERLHFLQTLDGAFMTGTNDKGERIDVPFTYDDVVQHIGLSVNVSDITDAKWWSNRRRDWAYKVKREIDNAREAKEEAHAEATGS